MAQKMTQKIKEKEKKKSEVTSTMKSCFFVGVWVFLMILLIANAGDSVSGDPSISQVTLLLPFSSDLERVYHTLTASSGCFKW